MKRDKKFYFSFLSLFLIIIANLLLEFKHLFGFAKGYAPHNFAFNGLIYQPILFIAFIFSLITFYKVFKSWNEKKNIVLIFIALPAFLYFIFRVLL